MKSELRTKEAELVEKKARAEETAEKVRVTEEECVRRLSWLRKQHVSTRKESKRIKLLRRRSRGID